MGLGQSGAGHLSEPGSSENHWVYSLRSPTASSGVGQLSTETQDLLQAHCPLPLPARAVAEA